MKKLIACLLALTLLVGILPSALAANETATSAATKAIKVLTIGEDFSRASMTNYLHEVLTSEGYTDITLGHMYATSHFTLGGYVRDYKNNKGPDDPTIYTLELNRVGYWDIIYRYTLPMVLEEDDWDYVILQTSPIQSTKADEFAKDVADMSEIVKTFLPKAKIGLHVNWAFQKGYENSSSDFRYLYKFGYYYSKNGTTGQWVADAKVAEQNDRDQFKAQFNADPNTMYEAIAKAAQQVAKQVDFVVPAGTALMNAETSFLGDLRADEGEPVVDGANINETGKLVTSYAWYAALTGKKVEDVKHYRDFLFDLSSAERKAIAEAVNNAIAKPYQITPASAYKTEPTQYKVTVNGRTEKHLPGDVMAIEAQALRGANRMFLNWSVEKGKVTLANAKSLTTTFTVPAQDVEVKAVYTAAEAAGQLMVGFGRGDTSPQLGVTLDGYGDFTNRPNTGPETPEDKLYGNAVAISDGTTTHILISMDHCTTDTTWLNWLRERVEAETGLPGSCITVSATHAHSAPSFGEKQPIYRQAPQATKASNPEYYKIWMDGMTKACADALADLKPVSETKVNSISVPGMNWQRHWRYTGGVMSGVNVQPALSGGRYKGVTRDADNELQVIRFVRDNAKDVVLVNWQGHNHLRGSGKEDAEQERIYYTYTADVAGSLYRYLEKMDDDCYAIVFFGASGNLHMVFAADYALQWRWTYLSKDHATYGAKLGDYVLDAMKNMTVVETGKVQNLTQVHKAIYNRDGYVTRDVEQEVVTIGDSIAFVGASYEMMDTSGMDVKNRSPYDTTFVLSNTGSNHYVGSWQIGHYTLLSEHAAYEAQSRSFHFILGTAEDFVDGLVAMLNKLYKK